LDDQEPDHQGQNPADAVALERATTANGADQGSG
jgi:hypothetical protein